MQDQQDSRPAPAPGPLALMKSEIESLKQEARKMDEVAKAYFAMKVEEDADAQSCEETVTARDAHMKGLGRRS
jgi:hypothetical protein